MQIGLIFLAMIVLLLSGCVSTKPTKIQTSALLECQSHVKQLEEELDDRDKEIDDLENELHKKEALLKKNEAKRSDVRTVGEIKEPLTTPTTSQIQRALKNAGYYNGPIDGKIGAKTQDAITEFQKDNQLKADGKVGVMTWKKLKPYLD